MAMGKAADYFGKKEEEVTAGEKAASFAAGALTFGIAPLIDSITGTNYATGILATGMHALAKKLTAVQEAVPKEALDRLEEINNKQLMGIQLTQKERKLQSEIIQQKLEFDKFDSSKGNEIVQMTKSRYDFLDDVQARHFLLMEEADKKSYLDKLRGIHELKKQEFQALRAKMIMNGTLTAEETKRFKLLAKQVELSPLERMMKRLSSAWFDFTLKAEVGIEKHLALPFDEFAAGVQDKLATMTLGKVVAYRTEYEKNELKARKDIIGTLEEQADAYLKGVKMGGPKGLSEVQKAMGVITSNKAYGMSALGSYMTKGMLNRAELMADEQIDKLSELYKQQEEMHKETQKTWSGIGSDTRAMKDVIAKPAAPSRADLIGAMIGTYGMTSWTFHI
jgi:hypothetical protein